ncbi:hypothetical protein D3C84_949550 [compost metagenome]
MYFSGIAATVTVIAGTQDWHKIPVQNNQTSLHHHDYAYRQSSTSSRPLSVKALVAIPESLASIP